MPDQYRFITGTLYEFSENQNAYVAVWTNALDDTEEKAIHAYESFMCDDHPSDELEDL